MAAAGEIASPPQISQRGPRRVRVLLQDDAQKRGAEPEVGDAVSLHEGPEAGDVEQLLRTQLEGGASTQRTEDLVDGDVERGRGGAEEDVTGSGVDQGGIGQPAGDRAVLDDDALRSAGRPRRQDDVGRVVGLRPPQRPFG